jgi:hypothetical protein
MNTIARIAGRREGGGRERSDEINDRQMEGTDGGARWTETRDGSIEEEGEAGVAKTDPRY